MRLEIMVGWKQDIFFLGSNDKLTLTYHENSFKNQQNKIEYFQGW